MATFLVTDPDSGRKLRLTGDSPPTEQELEQIFSQLPQVAEPTLGEQAVGALETAGTLVSGAIAEPTAGIAGLAAGGLTAIGNLASDITGVQQSPAEAAARTVEATREAATFQPRTEAGQAQIQAVGEAIQPVAEAFQGAEQALGGATLEATGSPALAAVAATIPTALLELTGAASAKGITKLRSGKELDRAIQSATPSSEQLKSASRQVFNELSESGVTVKPEAIGTLADNMERAARKSGARPRTNQKVFGVIDEFKDIVEEGRTIPLDELDELRDVAQLAAKSNDPSEIAPALAMIDEIDGFLDDAGSGILNQPKGKNIGTEYRAARKIWGRARRSEMLQEAFLNAKDTASGFENGLRIELRKIIKSKRKSQFFTAGELASIKRASQGTTAANNAKLLGRLGFSEGQAINIVNPLLGGAAGAAAFGTTGGLAVPIIGQVSKGLAQRLTAKSARFADQVVRAGGNADEITKAYLRNTPKAQRSASELAELFVRNEIDLGTVKSAIAKEAADIARQARAFKTGALVGGELRPEDEE